MSKPTDVHPTGASLYFLPTRARMPVKFGPEICTEVTCARVRLTVRDANGRTAVGWGETPLSVQWVWPSSQSYEARHEVLKKFVTQLAEAWSKFSASGHPMEVGDSFQHEVLPKLTETLQRERGASAEPLPWLAALVCCSAFDLALHDAYGVLHGVPTYRTYTSQYLNADLAHYLKPADGIAR